MLMYAMAFLIWTLCSVAGGVLWGQHIEQRTKRRLIDTVYREAIRDAYLLASVTPEPENLCCAETHTGIGRKLLDAMERAGHSEAKNDLYHRFAGMDL